MKPMKTIRLAEIFKLLVYLQKLFMMDFKPGTGTAEPGGGGWAGGEASAPPNNFFFQLKNYCFTAFIDMR